MIRLSSRVFQSYSVVSCLVIQEVWRRIRVRFCIFLIHFWPFSVRSPDRILIAPKNFRVPDPKIAYQIYSSRYPLSGHLVDTNGVSPFHIRVSHAEWNRALHDFNWLRHLQASGTELSAGNARALISDWISLHGRHIQIKNYAWEPYVTARRLISWLQCSSFILSSAEPSFQRSFLKSLAFQTRYLRKISFLTHSGTERLYVSIAVVFAALCLPSLSFSLRSANHYLAQELDHQILPDGGHFSRNPGLLIDLLTDLLSLKYASLSQGELPSRTILGALDRMFPAVRFFQHRDGSIARFNGTGATHHDQILLLFDHDDGLAETLLHAPHSGYERLALGETTVLADTGSPPPVDVSHSAHAGCLAFELSSGSHNFVINCGVDVYGFGELHSFARATAAHSTATLNDTSQARFMTRFGWLYRLIQNPLIGGASSVACRRLDSLDSQGFIARHNAYVKRYGIFHEREMHLSENGNLLIGTDRFFSGFGSPVSSRSRDHVALRFHIHPDVELCYVSEGSFSLVARSGECWTFKTYDTPAMIEESIFFASPNGPQLTKQVVLCANISKVSVVHWKMQRDSS